MQHHRLRQQQLHHRHTAQAVVTAVVIQHRHPRQQAAGSVLCPTGEDLSLCNRMRTTATNLIILYPA